MAPRACPLPPHSAHAALLPALVPTAPPVGLGSDQLLLFADAAARAATRAEAAERCHLVGGRLLAAAAAAGAAAAAELRAAAAALLPAAAAAGVAQVWLGLERWDAVWRWDDLRVSGEATAKVQRAARVGGMKGGGGFDNHGRTGTSGNDTTRRAGFTWILPLPATDAACSRPVATPAPPAAPSPRPFLPPSLSSRRVIGLAGGWWRQRLGLGPPGARRQRHLCRSAAGEWRVEVGAVRRRQRLRVPQG